MDHDCCLKIRRFEQRNSPVAVLFTIKRRSSFLYLYGLGFLICAWLSYGAYMNQNDEFHQYSVYSLTCALFSIYAYKTLNFTQEEGLLITVPLNIQFTKTNRLGRTSVNYIPWDSVKDLAIIEVITGQRVLFYLTLMLKKKTPEGANHIILFRETKPRLKHLEEIYREAQMLIDRCR